MYSVQSEGKVLRGESGGSVADHHLVELIKLSWYEVDWRQGSWICLGSSSSEQTRQKREVTEDQEKLEVE